MLMTNDDGSEKSLYDRALDAGKKLVAGVAIGATLLGGGLAMDSKPVYAEELHSEKVEVFEEYMEDIVADADVDSESYEDVADVYMRSVFAGEERFDDVGEVDEGFVEDVYGSLSEIIEEYAEIPRRAEGLLVTGAGHTSDLARDYRNVVGRFNNMRLADIFGDKQELFGTGNIGETVFINYNQEIEPDEMKEIYEFDKDLTGLVEKAEEFIDKEDIRSILRHTVYPEKVDFRDWELKDIEGSRERRAKNQIALPTALKYSENAETVEEGLQMVEEVFEKFNIDLEDGDVEWSSAKKTKVQAEAIENYITGNLGFSDKEGVEYLSDHKGYHGIIKNRFGNTVTLEDIVVETDERYQEVIESIDWSEVEAYDRSIEYLDRNESFVVEVEDSRTDSPVSISDKYPQNVKSMVKSGSTEQHSIETLAETLGAPLAEHYEISRYLFFNEVEDRHIILESVIDEVSGIEEDNELREMLKESVRVFGSEAVSLMRDGYVAEEIHEGLGLMFNDEHFSDDYQIILEPKLSNPHLSLEEFLEKEVGSENEVDYLINHEKMLEKHGDTSVQSLKEDGFISEEVKEIMLGSKENLVETLEDYFEVEEPVGDKSYFELRELRQQKVEEAEFEWTEEKREEFRENYDAEKDEELNTTDYSKFMSDPLENDDDDE